MEVIVKLLAAGAIMGVMDFVWLGFVAKKLYYDEMGKILLEKPNMSAALIFYAIYVIGVVMFVISPALEKGSLTHAAVFGALFGLVAYATYDLTNLATLKGFSSRIVAIDLLWGMVITSAMSIGAYLAVKALF